MAIIINGERKTIETPINITDLLEILNISVKLVAVAINGEIPFFFILKRNTVTTTSLKILMIIIITRK